MKNCKDCGLSVTYHIQTWFDEIISSLTPQLKFPRKFELFFNFLIEKFFLFVGLIKIKNNFLLSEIQMRSACFISEARKQGIKFKATKGPVGYTNYFCAEINDKKVHFEGLPVAEHISKYHISFVDCKERTKNRLKKGGFPISEGKSFWFWQNKQALKYGINKINFPLVVKPRSGSVARHVTTNIENKQELQKAINKAVIYSPVFIIERFVKNSFVYRATVVDFNFIAVAKQIPANIIGNGNSTIQKLVEEKNNNKQRSKLHSKIIINKLTIKLLAKKNYNLQSVPKKNEIIYLQKDSFLKLGGDVIEITEKVHIDNIQLFKNIAIFFDIRLVGIDFLIPDISNSWKNQSCAVIELNNMPCIEVHHFPLSGTPQNVAKAIVDLFFKYHL